ncbi:MAG: hypothetical protein ABJE29_09020, partial [Balneola sp.]
MKSFTMQLTTKLFGISLLLIIFTQVFIQNANAQTKNPFREYTNPDEIVTFDRSTSYTEAIEIFNQFAQEYENKF